MHLIYGALVVLVVTLIVTESYLFRPVRAVASKNQHLGVLFSCFLCFGTWVGLAVGYFLPGPFFWVLDGLAFQGLACIIHELIGLIQDLRIRLQR